MSVTFFLYTGLIISNNMVTTNEKSLYLWYSIYHYSRMKRYIIISLLLTCFMMVTNAADTNFIEGKIMGKYSTSISNTERLENGTMTATSVYNMELGFGKLFKTTITTTVVYNILQGDYKNKMTFTYRHSYNGMWMVKNNMLYEKRAQGSLKGGLVNSTATKKDELFAETENNMRNQSKVLNGIKDNTTYTIINFNATRLKLRSKSGIVFNYKRVK